MSSDDDTEVCCVCGAGWTLDDNTIVWCSGCGMSVHQHCYDIPDTVDLRQEDWFCMPCSMNINPGALTCILCPAKKGGRWPWSGAFKPTSRGKWVHVQCADWLEEGGTTTRYKYFYGVEARREETCCVCRQRGKCVECSEQHCKLLFHPVCIFAPTSGISYAVQRPGRLDWVYKAYCHYHQLPDKYRLSDDCYNSVESTCTPMDLAEMATPPMAGGDSNGSGDEEAPAVLAQPPVDNECQEALIRRELDDVLPNIAQARPVGGSDTLMDLWQESLAQWMSRCAGMIASASGIRYVSFCHTAVTLLDHALQWGGGISETLLDGVEMLYLFSAYRILNSTVELPFPDRPARMGEGAVRWPQEAELSIRAAVAGLHHLRVLCRVFMRRHRTPACAPGVTERHCVWCLRGQEEDAKANSARLRSCADCELVIHGHCCPPSVTKGCDKQWVCPICRRSRMLLRAVQENDVHEIREALLEGVHADPFWVPPKGGNPDSVVGDPRNTAVHVAVHQSNYDALSMLLHHLRRGLHASNLLSSRATRLPTWLPENGIGDTPWETAALAVSAECWVLLQSTFASPMFTLPRRQMEPCQQVTSSRHPRQVCLTEDVCCGRERLPVPCFALAKGNSVPAPERFPNNLFAWARCPAESYGVLFDWKLWQGNRDGPAVSTRQDSGLVPCACKASCTAGFNVDQHCEHHPLKKVHSREVAECNYLCRCAGRREVSGTPALNGLKLVPHCPHRGTQNGTGAKLEMFWTPDGKGWGVRAGDTIPEGAFIAAYAGEVVTIQEYEKREETYKALAGVVGSYPIYLQSDKYVIDAMRYRSVAAFFNHVCANANMKMKAVYGNRMQKECPGVAFYAQRRIERGEELVFNYGVGITEGGHSCRPEPCLCPAHTW